MSLFLEPKSKFQTTNSKKIPKSKYDKYMKLHEKKPFDLQQRTLLFARSIRAFVKQLPRNIANSQDALQLIRSSGSVGANYIEANESLGKRDSLMRLKICRKEAKESMYWLYLLDTASDQNCNQLRLELLSEARELLLIFSAMLRKR